jgi:hypothetical protein
MRVIALALVQIMFIAPNVAVVSSTDSADFTGSNAEISTEPQANPCPVWYYWLCNRHGHNL